MGKPVKVYTESPGMKPGDEFFGIEFFLLEHPQGQIDDSNPDPIPLQVLNDRGKAYRIHLKNRGGRNQIADRPEKDGNLAKIIDRRSMQENQVRIGKHYRSIQPFHTASNLANRREKYKRLFFAKPLISWSFKKISIIKRIKSVPQVCLA